jgi:hypothetical protein
MATVRVTVGDVSVRVDGVDLSLRQVRDLLKLVAGINLAGGNQPAENDEPRQVIGFGAQVERLPEEILKEDLSWYFDEE